MVRVGEASPEEQEKARLRQEVFDKIKRESARQCEEGDMKAAMGATNQGDNRGSGGSGSGPAIRGHRRISQETFDEAVTENIEDLEMVRAHACLSLFVCVLCVLGERGGGETQHSLAWDGSTHLHCFPEHFW